MMALRWKKTLTRVQNTTQNLKHIFEYKLRPRIQNTSTLSRNHTWDVFWILGRATVK